MVVVWQACFGKLLFLLQGGGGELTLCLSGLRWARWFPTGLRGGVHTWQYPLCDSRGRSQHLQFPQRTPPMSSAHLGWWTDVIDKIARYWRPQVALLKPRTRLNYSDYWKPLAQRHTGGPVHLADWRTSWSECPTLRTRCFRACVCALWHRPSLWVPWPCRKGQGTCRRVRVKGQSWAEHVIGWSASGSAWRINWWSSGVEL